MYFERTETFGAELLPRQLYQKGIFFTGPLPTTVTAGVPTTLKWYGGSGKPVTITLKLSSQGDNGAEIVTTIASHASSPIAGGTYTWTPPKDIPNGNEYFYEIYQDVLNSAQTGSLIYSGGAAPSATLPSTLTASTTSVSHSHTSSATATVAPSVVVSIVTSVPNASSTSITSAANSHSGPPIAPIAVGAGIATAVLLLLAGIGFFFYRRRRRNRHTPKGDYHDNLSSTELVPKHPELSSESEIFEVRADQDVREIGTTKELGWLPAGTSRQELPSPIYRHELHTEESLFELEGSIVGDNDKWRETSRTTDPESPRKETEIAPRYKDRGPTGSGRRIT